MTAPNPKKLTGFIKRLLDILWYLFIAVGIILPIVTVLVGQNMLFDSDMRNVELFLGFQVTPDIAGQSESPKGAFIQGQDMVNIKTPSPFSWYLANTITEISLFIFLYGLAQMRALFGALVQGSYFIPDNVNRIQRVGYILIATFIVSPFVQFFAGRAMLAEINPGIQGIFLYPAFEVNVAGILIGLSLLVLAGVMREATTIQRDQSLTI